MSCMIFNQAYNFLVDDGVYIIWDNRFYRIEQNSSRIPKTMIRMITYTHAFLWIKNQEDTSNKDQNQVPKTPSYNSFDFL